MPWWVYSAIGMAVIFGTWCMWYLIARLMPKQQASVTWLAAQMNIHDAYMAKKYPGWQQQAAADRVAIDKLYRRMDRFFLITLTIAAIALATLMTMAVLHSQ